MSTASDYTLIAYHAADGVARLSHNRPQARNAESQGLLEELDHALQRAVQDPGVKVIVIDGKGAHFSAGHDLKEAALQRSNFTVEERWAFEERCYLGYAMKIHDSPKPTIAQVSGACIAGGFMVANMCDLVVASEEAFFSDPVCQTLATAAVEVMIHPWVMGARKAKEFLYLGGRMSAQEAHAVGMVNRVVPREALQDEVDRMAARIAQCDAFALRLVKRSINRGLEMQGLRAAIDAHFDTHQLSHLSEGFQRQRAAGLGNAIQAAARSAL